MYTVNRLLNPNLDLDELFIETMCAKRQLFFVILSSFHVFLSVPGLVIFAMYIKSPLLQSTAVFKIRFLVIFVHYIVP